ncbi:MAG: His-Xaa-Ser system radical SAM maturase HxsC [Proteobacteria bacterium]|nr:His-Xaa-Ser system radical SAM maturase HxsC [Pseudomonadota bacterium]
MITLGDKIQHTLPSQQKNVVVKVKADTLLPISGPHAVRVYSAPSHINKKADFYLTDDESVFANLDKLGVTAVLLPPTLAHIEEGDIIRVTSGGSHLRVLIKKSHRQNSFLLTERCNNWCIMCSQPPRDIDDSYIVHDVMEAIKLIDPDTREIGFTGGEPTLVGEHFFKLIKAAKNYLPRTSLHILSNGRNFSKEPVAKQVGDIAHHDLMIGIPIYADNASDHNYVVQADAFQETTEGIFNLKRHGVKVEIRVVLHSATYERLPDLARFIVRNLLFVDQVALMGLEAMGFGKSNFQSLWIDPGLLIPKVDEAIGILHRARIRTMVYNLPLCVLGDISQTHSVRSISDWKNEYLEECDSCTKKAECCGFFFSTKQHYKNLIKPFLRK